MTNDFYFDSFWVSELKITHGTSAIHFAAPPTLKMKGWWSFFGKISQITEFDYSFRVIRPRNFAWPVILTTIKHLLNLQRILISFRCAGMTRQQLPWRSWGSSWMVLWSKKNIPGLPLCYGPDIPLSEQTSERSEQMEQGSERSEWSKAEHGGGDEQASRALQSEWVSKWDS